MRLRELIVLLVLCLLPISSTNYKMVVTWGQPSSFSGYSTLSFSFETCVETCLNSSTCVVVSSNTTESCLMFRLDQISSVEKLDSTYSSKVGIKTTFDSEPSCPSGSEEPLISGSTSSGDSYLNDAVYQEYSIGYSSPLWTFSTTKTISCPSTDWKLFFRPLGQWCIQMTITSSGYTKDEAGNKCAATPGGVLSAIQNVDELNYIYEQIETLSEQVPMDSTYKRTGVWLGGQRKDTCMYNLTRTDSCNGSNEFNYDDPTFQLPGYYPWNLNQPSGMLTTSGENCILTSYFTGIHGLDDSLCNMTAKDYLLMRGQVCGVVPTVS